MSFSDGGRFVGYVGAEGKGPGEFETSSSVVVGPGDLISVFDTELDRLLVYEPQTLQYAFGRNTVDTGLSISSPYELLGVTEKGCLFEFKTPLRPPGNELDVEPNGPRYSVINLLGRKDAIVKTNVATLPAGERVVRTQGSSITVMPLPFDRTPFFVYENGLLYAGWNDSIYISVISESGKEVQIINFAHEVLPVTRREIENKSTNSLKRNRRLILRSELLRETNLLMMHWLLMISEMSRSENIQPLRLNMPSG